jgi:hypothetical protein
MKDKLAREMLVELGEACAEFNRSVKENIEATDKMIDDNYANVMLMLHSILDYFNIRLDRKENGIYAVSKKITSKASIKKVPVKKNISIIKKSFLRNK